MRKWAEFYNRICFWTRLFLTLFLYQQWQIFPWKNMSCNARNQVIMLTSNES